ncbi:MAG TPA: glucose 1-dehydrogenase [Xanthobacteraceae bacterium]|nr:glucose 1-dehydrogenase [Xanthobacteraceae bacterium]
MRAITVHPLHPNSIELRDVPEPVPAHGALLAEAIALGVCGTDREIIAGDYGAAPDGAERLILGHESLGRVLEAPSDSDFKKGDPIVGIVRQPDPVPCAACAAGQWDMCRNGQYTEHGIKGLNGFGAERWRIDPAFAVKVDPALGLNAVLMEPTSVVAKAWDHAHRLWRLADAPRRVLVTGAGPIGLLAALLGKQRGFDVHVYDHNKGGPKPAITAALGATYHCDSVEDLARLNADIVIECTGVPGVIATLLLQVAPDSLICLTGVGSSRRAEFDIGWFNRNMVLNNGAVFGSVNANLRHYRMAAEALSRADPKWLARLITRRVPLDRFADAFDHRKGDIKTVIEFAA